MPTRRVLAGTVPFALVAIMLIVLTGACAPQSVAVGAPLEAFVAHLDESVPRSMRSDDVPGVAIALVRGGVPVWLGAYGDADRERDRPMTVDAVFQTGSISKSVSAWGALRLVELGLVGLDDPVTVYLGEGVVPTAANPAEAITLRRVLSHTAGAALGPIGDEYPPDGAVPSLRTALARDLRLVRAPGTGFGYSNPGFDVVELLIEEVSGRPFAAFMEDEVLRPLGMHDAGFVWREHDRPRVPSGYDLRGTPVAPYVYPGKASGGLFATVGDIARFVAASVAADGTAAALVLSDAGVRALHEPVVPIPGVFGVVADAYALGHFIEVLPDGGRAVWHGGQGNGWMTHFHAVPATGDGIVILTNSQRSWPLMSRTLRDWAAWAGVGPVKFGRISTGVIAVWLLIAAIVALSLWTVVRLAYAVRSGRRRFAPGAAASRGPRALQALAGIAVLVVLAWRSSQPYLIETSVFPGVAAWLGWAIAALAGVLTTSAAFAPCAGRHRSGTIGAGPIDRHDAAS